jgi:hypothetical protein
VRLRHVVLIADGVDDFLGVAHALPLAVGFRLLLGDDHGDYVVHALVDGNDERDVVGLGDPDADGFARFAISAPGAASSIGDVGAVYLFDGPLDASLGVDEAPASLWGLASGDRFGATLASGQDLDADGDADLLVTANAPKFMEYLSLDTEGTEYDILKALDFSKWVFGLIDVEHNFEEAKRESIRRLLESNGYVFLRQNKWDDCYIHHTQTSEVSV